MINEKKNIQRQYFKEKRIKLSADKKEIFSNQICDKIIESNLYKSSKTIMSYVSYNGEVDLKKFHDYIYDSNKIVCFPVCDNNGIMSVYSPLSADAFQRGKYNIFEPIVSKSKKISPKEIDLILTPCVAFDSNRNRLGQGAGYYDRFLPQCVNGTSIGIAYEVQNADKIIIDKIYDEKLDYILTEKKWY